MTPQITNFRSLGGYSTANGTTKDGLLYRSGQLADLSDSQVDFLANDLKIKRIVDMRGADELSKDPDTTWPGADYENLDILADATANNASLGRMITETGSVYDNMMFTYEQLATSNSARQGYKTFLTQLVEKDEPTVFHCFAGKDRTGVGAAIILTSVGVSEDQVFEDYLKTNASRQIENEKILKSLEGQLTEEQLKSVGVALRVNPDYLKHFFDTAKKEFGSFDAYLHDGLSLPTYFEDRLIEQYVK